MEYQKGTLFEAEVWEYLLEKFGRKCYYCGAKDIPLEKEHILPKAKGRTNRVSNLTVSCKPCNQKKGNKHLDEIQGDLGKRVQSALCAAKKPLKDAQAVNTIRWKIVEILKATGLPVVCATTADTKYNRKRAGFPKEHYCDAACVNCIPSKPDHLSVLAIHAVGYGHRQDLGNYQTKQTAPGFKSPYTRIEHAAGFQKLDTVEMRKKNGKSIGCINSFDKTPDGKPQKLRVKTDWTDGDGRVGGNTTQLRRIQRSDGYAYQIITSEKQRILSTEDASQLLLFDALSAG